MMQRRQLTSIGTPAAVLDFISKSKKKSTMATWNRSVRGSFGRFGRFSSSCASPSCVLAAAIHTVVQDGRGIVRLLSSSSSSKDSTDSTALVRGLSTAQAAWDAASAADNRSNNDRPHWSEERKNLGFGAELVNEPFPSRLFFVQLGFGVDQHGDAETTSATKAAIRAVRNAIEFNSIPGVISNLPGGRHEMRIHVRLGVPGRHSLRQPDVHLSGVPMSQQQPDEPLPVDPLEVAKVFPYGKLLPIEVCLGGLAFHTGRVVEELGDTNDVGVCVAACVSIGYNDRPDVATSKESDSHQTHVAYSTKDGY
jgi:uncharacterized protein (TIGR02058 family)